MCVRICIDVYVLTYISKYGYMHTDLGFVLAFATSQNHHKKHGIIFYGGVRRHTQSERKYVIYELAYRELVPTSLAWFEQRESVCWLAIVWCCSDSTVLTPPHACTCSPACIWPASLQGSVYCLVF